MSDTSGARGHCRTFHERAFGVGTGVFFPRGEALAMSGGTARVVHAEVDLEDIPRTGPGATFRGVCWYERREPAYGPLVGDLLPDPFDAPGGAGDVTPVVGSAG